MMDKAFEIIVDKICDKRVQIADALVNGSAKDFAEYRALCGEVRGLLTAQSYIEDLARRMEQSDD